MCASPRFREVAEHVEVFEIHRPVEQLVFDELLELAEKHIEAADQAEVAHYRPGEKADHVLVVRRECRIHLRDVALLIGVHVTEDDLALLLGRELLQRHALMRAAPPHRGH